MSWAEQWTETVLETFARLRTAFAEVIPDVIGALIILGVGYLASKIIQKVTAAVLRRIGLDGASRTVGVSSFLEKMKVTAAPSAVVAAIVFWFFMLVFLIAATETLGLQALSATFATIVSYFPNVLGALAIAVFGAIGARFVRDAVHSATDRIGVEFARPLSQVIYGVLLVVVVSLAVGQLKLETALVNRTVEVILLATGAAIALTLGLGTRDVARNLIAGMYARDVYRPRMTMTVAGSSGTVEEVGAVNTRIRTSTGEAVYIPNGQLMETVVRGASPSEAPQ